MTEEKKTSAHRWQVIQSDEGHATVVNALPLLPLRDVVVLPHMVVPLFAGREKSIRALEVAMERDQIMVVLVAQKFPENDNPNVNDAASAACRALCNCSNCPMARLKIWWRVNRAPCFQRLWIKTISCKRERHQRY